METIYLVCLIFGGFFLAVSIFAGTEADADFGLETDADFNTESAELGGEGVTSAIQYLSFRNIVFFVAFFGLTGFALSKLETPAIVAFAIASALGFFAASVGHKVMSYLRDSEVSGTMDLRDLEGQSAKVVVNLTKSKRGKISVNSRDRIFQLLALVADEASKDAFQFGDSVTIIRVESNVVYVAEPDFIQ
ncbi:MAG: hypothetical protein H6695_07905 [Deferribacteres bacterium]|nr:hypothetical protein [candidate division KSB1 bacterium]MCB9510090.1 hypothetical protein [Deferribacteres bacterium]